MAAGVGYGLWSTREQIDRTTKWRGRRKMSAKRTSAPLETIQFKVGNKKVEIEVSLKVKEAFNVARHDDSKDMQRKRYLAVMDLLAAAYRAGKASK